MQTLQTALEVLDIGYSILLKGTRLDLNFKLSPNQRRQREEQAGKFICCAVRNHAYRDFPISECTRLILDHRSPELKSIVIHRL